MTNVLITDRSGKIIGEEDFDLALKKKLIRRIVRVFAFNKKGELFVQKRGPTMKICPRRWDSSSAGHVDPGETSEDAAVRELQEELGITSHDLTKIADYYNEEWEDNLLVRKAFTTLYALTYPGKIHVDGEEVTEGKWMALEQLHTEIRLRQKQFSPGFVNALEQYKKLLCRKS